jgi:hypothetical protein
MGRYNAIPPNVNRQEEAKKSASSASDFTGLRQKKKKKMVQ